MYSYIFDKKTGGYLLTTQTGKYVANEIRPVYAPELAITRLGRHFEYNKNETRPLMWGIKNTYIVADVDESGNPTGRKVAQLNKTQYGKPMDIQVFFDGKMKLLPVDIEAMVAANAQIMDIVTADAKRRTKELFDESIERCDIAYIAFSGGKDSVTLLDICHKVLPLSVPVVFSDTDMELPDTYKVWDEIQTLYPEREFIKAKSEMTALESWRVFGPPSRTIKWCCSVHKSTPAIIYLKKKLRKSAIKAMAFVGVRGDESHSRSFYEDASDGKKNASQMNLMPILEWGAHELWLYIFANELVVNCAYQKGMARVGCVLCPETSRRYTWFVQKSYPHIVKAYADVVINTSKKKFATVSEKEDYVGSVDWAARKSGIVLKETLTYPLQESNELKTTFLSPHLRKKVFFEWINTLGTVVVERDCERTFLKIANRLDVIIPFSYHAPYTGGGIVTFEFSSENERNDILPLFNALLSKSVACVSCQTCEAQCDYGAISYHDEQIAIDAYKCKQCYKCNVSSLNCWRFKSMYKSDSEPNKMSGINKYNHFGLRENWVSVLNEMGKKFFPWKNDHPIGKKMVEAASIWFQQALILEQKTRKPTMLAKLFAKKSSIDSQCWELVWLALANNAILIKWYICETDVERPYTITEFMEILSTNYPNLGESTKKDGLTSLKETIARSPLGASNGVALCEFKGKALKSITRKSKPVHSLTILYGMYLIAELSGRSCFTVRELLTADIDSTFVSPIVAFGISPDVFKKQCEGLRTRYPAFISTTFTHGNDGIEVYPQKYKLDDIVSLALEDL